MIRQPRETSRRSHRPFRPHHCSGPAAIVASLTAVPSHIPHTLGISHARKFSQVRFHSSSLQESGTAPGPSTGTPFISYCHARTLSHVRFHSGSLDGGGHCSWRLQEQAIQPTPSPHKAASNYLHSISRDILCRTASHQL